MRYRKGTKRSNIVKGYRTSEIKRRKRDEALDKLQHTSLVGPNISSPDKNAEVSSSNEDDLKTCESRGEELPELVIEYESPPPESDPGLDLLSGNIIIDVRHFLVACRNLERHKCSVSASGTMQLKEVRKLGLITILKFRCNTCNEENVITSEKTENLLGGRKNKQERKLTLNEKAVWGSLSIGSGCNPIQELLSVMDIDGMSANVFAKHENFLGNRWEQILQQAIEAAIEEEIALAKSANPPRVVEGNIPWTIVILDGGWSQRSYGHRYSALSGCAVIIGYYTKKILFLGIRNKYCTACARAENRNEEPKPHKCFKNWSGSSTAMEADIIVEGFQFCEKVYNIRFLKFVGDGDSSVYFNLTNKVSYGRSIQKIDCANHIMKNLKKNLYALAKGAGTKYLSAPRINHIARTARKAIANNTGDESLLASDIQNVTNHVYGCHTNCREILCDKVGQTLLPCLLEEIPRELLVGIRKEVSRVASKAHVLVMNMTSNNAEAFMALAARFSGGKQINRSQHGSYNRRITGAGLKFQFKYKWHAEAMRKVTGSSPQRPLKRLIAKNERHNRICCRRLYKRPILKGKSKPNGDKDYGPKSQQPAAKGVELEQLKSAYLQALKTNDVSRQELEESTRQQRESQRWREERSKRLTASHFGTICKMRDTTSCRSTVSSILYPLLKKSDTPATRYGIVMENVAITQYEKDKEVNVTKCGLFVDEKEQFLAASPDGLVGESGLIEVKCPYSLKDRDPKTIGEKNQYGILKNNKLLLNENHNYYFQIQGQLHVTKREWCDLIIWSHKGYLEQRIFRNDSFWETRMLQKLRRFYLSCMLPELADSCRDKGLPIREPLYIIEAQKNRDKKMNSRK